MVTTQYWPVEWDPEYIDSTLAQAMSESGIRPKDQNDLLALMAPLRIKSFDHWCHSVRVGLLAKKMADAMGLDGRALLFAGLGHDIGKALVTAKTLNKTDGWTPEDSETMKTHVPDGWRLLRDRFDFTAEVMAWHHRFQKNCYPVETLPLLQPHDVGTSTIIPFYGRLLALADVFDALHRQNPKKLTGFEISEAINGHAPDLHTLTQRFYKTGILTRWENTTREK